MPKVLVEMSMSLDGRHPDTASSPGYSPTVTPGRPVARTFGTGLPSASPRGRIVRVFAAGFRQRVTPV